MTYATAQDLVDFYDAQRLADLAGEDAHAGISGSLLRAGISGGDLSQYDAQDLVTLAIVTERIDTALDASKQIIHAYAGQVYELPLSGDLEIIKPVAVDLAIYRLYKDGDIPEAVKERYNRAIKVLEDVRDQKIALNATKKSQSSNMLTGSVSYKPGQKGFGEFSGY